MHVIFQTYNSVNYSGYVNFRNCVSSLEESVRQVAHTKMLLATFFMLIGMSILFLSLLFQPWLIISPPYILESLKTPQKENLFFL